MIDPIKHYDVLLVGGGPAGMSAALWCADLGLHAVLFERESKLGGQLTWTHNPITNYLGIDAADGLELRDRFARQVEDRLIEHRTNAEVVNTDAATPSVQLASGERFTASAVILAMGVRRRRLGIAGENEFVGKGILESGAKQKKEIAGKRVVIIGGGDAALENALILSDHAQSVTVVHRRAEFTARRAFIAEARSRENVEFRLNTRVTAVAGNDLVNGVEIENIISRDQHMIPTESVLIRIGVEPNTDLVGNQIKLDEHGYIVIDSECRTSYKNIFAIGDIAVLTAKTLASAIGMGAVAARAILNDEKNRPKSPSPNF